MNTYKPYNTPSNYGRKSTLNLNTCHDDLQILLRALRDDGWDISVVCGHRGEYAQTQAYIAEKSNARWPDSKHNTLPSEAVDIAPYIPGVGIPWEDPLPWYLLAGAMMQKAKDLNIGIRWGGYFKTIAGGDLGHWELVR